MGFCRTVSGLAREDSERPNIITTGGSGFGIASFIVGIERGWVSREDVINRMETVLNFLEGAEKYWSFFHWYDNSGNTIEFGDMDDGGDIVETALLIQGLLIVRQYFRTIMNKKQSYEIE